MRPPGGPRNREKRFVRAMVDRRAALPQWISITRSRAGDAAVRAKITPHARVGQRPHCLGRRELRTGRSRLPDRLLATGSLEPLEVEEHGQYLSDLDVADILDPQLPVALLKQPA